MTKALIAALLALTASTSQAALIDRGGGLIYDDVLNITWLQDANYAKTSGYDTDGAMDIDPARTWAANLSYFDSVRNVTWDDWRLPTVSPINGISFIASESVLGDTDVGYNMGVTGTPYAGSTSSEMAYMFYLNMQNQGFFSTTGAFSTCYPDCLVNVNPFINVQSNVYWAGFDNVPGTSQAWYIGFNSGYQGRINESTVAFYAWAVRDGDVAPTNNPSPIPEPSTLALLLIAGLSLIALKLKIGKQINHPIILEVKYA